MIEVRKRHSAFGLGDYHELGGSNPSVLAYVRSHTGADGTASTVLCVNNMSRFPQPVELDLSAWLGSPPTSSRAACRSRRSASCPTFLTLPGHGFYWFSITPPEDNS